MRVLISKLCLCFGENQKDDADTIEIPVIKKYTFSQGNDNSKVEEHKSDLTLGVPFERTNIKQDSLMLTLCPGMPCILNPDSDRRDSRFNTPSFNVQDISSQRVTYSAPCEKQKKYIKAKVKVKSKAKVKAKVIVKVKD